NQYEPILPALGAKLTSRGDKLADPLVPKQPRDEGDGRSSLRFGRRSEPHHIHAGTANENGAIRVNHLALDERLPIIIVLKHHPEVWVRHRGPKCNQCSQPKQAGAQVRPNENRAKTCYGVYNPWNPG